MNLVGIYASNTLTVPWHYYQSHGGNRSEANYSYEDKLGKNFLSKINSEDYYLFTINLANKELFLLNIQIYDLEKYIVFSSPKPAHNRIYPDSGPKLDLFILKFPKGYKYEAGS